MEVSIWAIIIAGVGVCISLGALVYTIFWNIRQDRRTDLQKRRLEKIEYQKLSIEEKKQKLAEEQNRPKVDIYWGSYFSLNENSGWFNGGKLHIDNMSTGSLRFSNWSFSYGNSEVEITGSVHSLKPADGKKISILFRRKKGIDEFKNPPPKVNCRVEVRNSIGQLYENVYEWSFTKEQNPYFKEVSSNEVN